MKKVALLALTISMSLLSVAQQLVSVKEYATGWTCVGRVWVDNDLYCKDGRTRDVAKFTPNGQLVFSRLEAAPVGKSSHIVGLAEFGADIYAIDGIHIHTYSAEGKYKSSITPGIQMTFGIVVLDPQNIVVSGHVPWKKNDSTASIFVVGPEGIKKSFGRPFFPQTSGIEGLVLNTPSSLALDRGKGLLYQLSPYVYEIRVYDLQGKELRIIKPPAQYGIRTVQLMRSDSGGVGIGPGDSLSDIAVLPDGRLAVTGTTLDSLSTQGATTMTTYSTFLDIYSSDGVFQRRIGESELHLAGTHFWGMDHKSGKAYFARAGRAIDAVVK